MSHSVKPKAVFTYCFQVWLTNILLGPVIFLFWGSATFGTFGDWIGFEVIVALYGAMFSIPALLLFSGGAAFLFLRSWSVNVKRLVLGIWGMLLTVATFGVLFQEPFSTNLGGFPGSICYLLPSFLSIWIYRWPGKMK